MKKILYIALLASATALYGMLNMRSAYPYLQRAYPYAARAYWQAPTIQGLGAPAYRRMLSQYASYRNPWWQKSAYQLRPQAVPTPQMGVPADRTFFGWAQSPSKLVSDNASGSTLPSEIGIFIEQQRQHMLQESLKEITKTLERFGIPFEQLGLEDRMQLYDLANEHANAYAYTDEYRESEAATQAIQKIRDALILILLKNRKS